MHLHDLNGRNVCILGFGREGQAALRALEKYAPNSSITIADKNKELGIENYEYQYGERYLNNLDRFDVIIKSPGIPPKELPSSVQHYTSATQIFFDSIAGTGATVIGVTGSKGKSTTASLIYKILTTHNAQRTTHNCYLIGNIGSPALDFLEHANSSTIFVHELSSYQLADLAVSPHIAVITSFFPEHLDYHGSLEAYREAKRTICRFQRETDIVFFADTPKETAGIATGGMGKKVPYGERDAPLKLEETRLIGHHNLSNIAAAWKVAEYLNSPRDVAVQALKEFQPLPHRLQSLGIHHSLEWVDDAISTTPESTIAALDALGDRVATIILGGLDRGYDFTTLAERIVSSAIQTVILFPGSGPHIRKAIEDRMSSRAGKMEFFEVDTMEKAVSIARRAIHLTPPTYHLTPICLLSTASPSYNMFKNFEEKGNRFQEAINTITVAQRKKATY